MTDKKILVLGGTGAQGGSVAHHLLSRRGFSVRCLTRDTGSERAAVLADAGAELVSGDLNSPDSLYNAARGCWGVFGVTNFWEHSDSEFQQGKNLVDAVQHAGVDHLILSTLPYVDKITKGELVVPHFDMKGQIEEYARSAGLGATFVHVAFYYENYLSYFPPQKQEDGTYSFGFPQGDTRLAAVSTEDIGGVAAAVFNERDSFRDGVVGIVGDDLPPAGYAEIMTRVLGKKVVYNYIPRDVFASFDFPGAEDLANMFEYNRLHIPDRRTDLQECRALYPGMQRFERWLIDNRDKFRL